MQMALIVFYTIGIYNWGWYQVVLYNNIYFNIICIYKMFYKFIYKAFLCIILLIYKFNKKKIMFDYIIIIFIYFNKTLINIFI